MTGDTTHQAINAATDVVALAVGDMPKGGFCPKRPKVTRRECVYCVGEVAVGALADAGTAAGTEGRPVSGDSGEREYQRARRRVA